jgi:hypothetical protein
MAVQPAIFLKPDAPLSNNLFPNGIPVSHSIPLLANADDKLLWSVPIDLLTVIQIQAIALALAKWSNTSVDRVQGLAVEKQLFGLPNDWFLLLFGSDLTQAEAEAIGRSARVTTELANSPRLYSLLIPAGSAIMLYLVLATALYAPGMPPPPPELTQFHAELRAKLVPTGLDWEQLTDAALSEAVDRSEHLMAIPIELTPYLIYLIVSAVGEFSLVSEQSNIAPLIVHIISPLRRVLVDDFPQVAAIILAADELPPTAFE